MDMSRFQKIEDGEVNLPDFTNIAKTEMYYFDENGKACGEDKAVSFIARMLDKDGNLVNETWGECTPVDKKEEGYSK